MAGGAARCANRLPDAGVVERLGAGNRIQAGGRVIILRHGEYVLERHGADDRRKTPPTGIPVFSFVVEGCNTPWVRTSRVFAHRAVRPKTDPPFPTSYFIRVIGDCGGHLRQRGRRRVTTAGFVTKSNPLLNK